MATSEQYDTTQKVNRMLLSKTQEEVAKLIGMTKVTLYTRLKFQNWKLTEISHIKNLKV
jgi:transcription initiation factor TFIIIB Brf1 subunit/transcription initiation factor TFIIB